MVEEELQAIFLNKSAIKEVALKRILDILKYRNGISIHFRESYQPEIGKGGNEGWDITCL